MSEESSQSPEPQNCVPSETEQIDSLCFKVIDLLWDAGPEAALPDAEKLALLIADLDVSRQYDEWIAIWMARGRLDKATEIGECYLDKQLREVESASLSYQKTASFQDDLAVLLDCLYLQADRYLKMSIRGAALTKMLEAQALSLKYEVPLDKHLQALLDELTASP